MYDSILVPVDGSDPSDAAVDHARGLASEQDATVHVLHAVEHPERGALGGRVPASVVEQMRAEGERLVAETADRLEDEGVEAETEVVDDSAVHAIPDYVDDHDVDLVVIGTHGRTGVRRVLLGSTAERTIRTVDCPVLTAESSP